LELARRGEFKSRIREYDDSPAHTEETEYADGDVSDLHDKSRQRLKTHDSDTVPESVVYPSRGLVDPTEFDAAVGISRYSTRTTLSATTRAHAATGAPLVVKYDHCGDDDDREHETSDDGRPGEESEAAQDCDVTDVSRVERRSSGRARGEHGRQRATQGVSNHTLGRHRVCTRSGSTGYAHGM